MSNISMPVKTLHNRNPRSTRGADRATAGRSGQSRRARAATRKRFAREKTDGSRRGHHSFTPKIHQPR
jgi:hypothetical protein